MIQRISPLAGKPAPPSILVDIGMPSSRYFTSTDASVLTALCHGRVSDASGACGSDFSRDAMGMHVGATSVATPLL